MEMLDSGDVPLEPLPSVVTARPRKREALLPLPFAPFPPARTRDRGPVFPVGPKAQALRARFYPQVADAQWNDWRWQLKNRITSYKDLGAMLDLSAEELAAASDGAPLPLAITPYYLSLFHDEGPDHGVRRTIVPTGFERLVSPGEAEDPLGEDCHSPVPGLVHRYPDRVLFLTTDFCAAYCRYCTRSRRVGKRACSSGNRKHWDAAIDYIARTPTVRDVLLSGGDPLTLSDAALDYLLGRVRAIPHVEIVRLGTKAPMVLPQRITPQLTRVLRRYHPLMISVHCAHPGELSPESAEAFKRLADAGIPLGSQTVLLKGVNDDVPTLKSLMHGLLKNRVRPYYLYHCDPVQGTAHFRTSVAKGVEMIEGLRGHTSGYAIPTFVVDAPGGGGKIPVNPDYIVGQDGDDLVLRNFEKKQFRTHDPLTAPACGAGDK